MSGGKILEQIDIALRHNDRDDLLTIHIDVFDNTLSRKWLAALNNILDQSMHLEKNYCFFGFADSPRNGEFLCNQINQSIQAINDSGIGYYIDDEFTVTNTLGQGLVSTGHPGRKIIQEKFNNLHRYFEDLQGTSGNISRYYHKASPEIKWHIRQLNLLCHEFESWALSYRKQIQAPEWQRPSQLMCWLNAPRFVLDEDDYEFFGIDTLTRPTGGVFVGVNKAVGKHHWEVFQDEGRDSRIDELTTTTLKSQTEAAGDFDIEWARSTAGSPFMTKQLDEFREWLSKNGFDPTDKSLTIGHPQVGQVDLERSFGTDDCFRIWDQLSDYLDVFSIKTSAGQTEYPYRWSDENYIQSQVDIIARSGR